MPNYQLMTPYQGFFMDVSRAIAKPSTAIDGYTYNSPPSHNQLWTLEPGPSPYTPQGYFFIATTLNPNLVVGTKGGSAAPGTTLELAEKGNQPSQVQSQLWRFMTSGTYFMAYGYIQSLLGGHLVVNDPSATRGTSLEIANQVNTASQLWWVLAGTDQNYNPTISSIVPAGRGFTITGTGFKAGAFVFANYRYVLAPSVSPGGQSSGSFLATTDFGGDFVNESPIDLLSGSPGSLAIDIFLPEGKSITADWTGSSFTNIHQ